MEFVIGSDESFYFDNKGYVEFDGIFTEKELKKLTENLEKLLEKRLEVSKEKFYRFKPKEWYLSGRDLAIESKEIRKILLSGKLGKIAAELVHQKPLRLASDQWIFGGEPLPLKQSLEKSFPFQGMVAGVVISLKNPFSNGENALHADSSLFPKTPGRIVFFKASHPYDFPPNFKTPAACSYLLVVITDGRAVYAMQENDPCTHHLKMRGYGFGDRLTDYDHPYLIR